MARFEGCGNDYDKAYELMAADERHSFECAIHRMAPVCEHCQCKVIGHGTEVDGGFFCCAHCAREATGSDQAQDRVERLSVHRLAASAGGPTGPSLPTAASPRSPPASANGRDRHDRVESKDETRPCVTFWREELPLMVTWAFGR